MDYKKQAVDIAFKYKYIFYPRNILWLNNSPLEKRDADCKYLDEIQLHVAILLLITLIPNNLDYNLIFDKSGTNCYAIKVSSSITKAVIPFQVFSKDDCIPFLQVPYNRLVEDEYNGKKYDVKTLIDEIVSNPIEATTFFLALCLAHCNIPDQLKNREYIMELYLIYNKNAFMEFIKWLLTLNLDELGSKEIIEKCLKLIHNTLRVYFNPDFLSKIFEAGNGYEFKRNFKLDYNKHNNMISMIKNQIPKLRCKSVPKFEFYTADGGTIIAEIKTLFDKINAKWGNELSMVLLFDNICNDLTDIINIQKENGTEKIEEDINALKKLTIALLHDASAFKV